MYRLVRALAALAVVLLPASGLAFVASPATATSTTLCTGYAGCLAEGMGAHGYPKVDDTMFWRMYSGHNCTNYVAYRMVDNGMPNVRPWSGGGNATFWGTENPGLTDDVPAVGAVAWWKANVRPAGSAGHVAYVEEVISADEIIVSQDSWGGDFSWARITRAGGSWPSGFVHFNDVELTNTTAPTVTGALKVGEVLTAKAGSWSPSGATYTYQWRSGGEDLAGATSSTYKIKKAQEGLRVRVKVTATKAGYPSRVAASAPSSVVQPGDLTNTAPPVITGDAVVDSTLTASAGTWTPAPTTLTYQWTADGEPIAGATAGSLALSPELVGQVISVAVTATRDGYLDATTTATPTPAVAPGTIAQTGTPVFEGDPLLGQTLTVDPGVFSPSDATIAVRWRRDGVLLPDTGADNYELTAADLGTQIRARVIVTRPGYTRIVTRTPITSPVMSPATLQVEPSSPYAGRARFDLTVTAPGVDDVTGMVRIRSGGKLVAEVTLSRGVGRVVLTGLQAGPTSFTLRYLGTELLAPTLPMTRTFKIS